MKGYNYDNPEGASGGWQMPKITRIKYFSKRAFFGILDEKT